MNEYIFGREYTKSNGEEKTILFAYNIKFKWGVQVKYQTKGK